MQQIKDTVLQVMQLTGTAWTKGKLKHFSGSMNWWPLLKRCVTVPVYQGSGQESQEFGIESEKSKLPRH
jgi:hypothetical protein